MSSLSLTFDAVAEARPGPKWRARWRRSWPAYEAWFTANGGDAGPDRAACEAALARHMPELVPVHRALTACAGGSDRAARFLSAWRPPAYLGGCSVAAAATKDAARLVRNYDLSPDLNEGLLLRSEWTGRPVIGMVEFLWGVSDGINADGLAVALAYGGRREVGAGFGITLILRYLLETCATVEQALRALERIPSHMAYNVVLADRLGATASVELHPGGGLRMTRPAVATNHQEGFEAASAWVQGSAARRRHLEGLVESMHPHDLLPAFLEPPLHRTDHAGGFGTLFTAEYDPGESALTLRWPNARWSQSLGSFEEGRRIIRYDGASSSAPLADAAGLGGMEGLFDAVRAQADAVEGARWIADARRGAPDWRRLGMIFAASAS